MTNSRATFFRWKYYTERYETAGYTITKGHLLVACNDSTMLSPIAIGQINESAALKQYRIVGFSFPRTQLFFHLFELLEVVRTVCQKFWHRFHESNEQRANYIQLTRLLHRWRRSVRAVPRDDPLINLCYLRYNRRAGLRDLSNGGILNRKSESIVRQRWNCLLSCSA